MKWFFVQNILVASRIRTWIVRVVGEDADLKTPISAQFYKILPQKVICKSSSFQSA